MSNVTGTSAEIAGAKVRVYAKAQNRAALGIMHAYMVINPKTTLTELQNAFPDSLNPDSGVKKNFVYADEKGTDANWDGFFRKEDEVLTMGDGKKVSVVTMWTKPSFERLVQHAKQYGIIIADFEAAGPVGEKGRFRLEYLNGFTPGVAEKKKKRNLLWLWILAGVIALGALIWWLLAGRKPKVIEREVVRTEVVRDTIVVRDTVMIQQIDEIERNFNAAQFEANKAELSEDAKFVLHDLAKVMQNHPEVRLRLVGHTSAEGTAEHNQKLSEERAAAAVKFLVEKEGIDAARLESEGKGSSELKNTADPMAPENRRTEFIVLDGKN